METVTHTDDVVGCFKHFDDSNGLTAAHGDGLVVTARVADIITVHCVIHGRLHPLCPHLARKREAERERKRVFIAVHAMT